MKQQGFSLIEFLIAIGIALILAMLAVPLYRGYTTSADEAVVVDYINEMSRELQTYAATHEPKDNCDFNPMEGELNSSAVDVRLDFVAIDPTDPVGGQRAVAVVSALPGGNLQVARDVHDSLSAKVVPGAVLTELMVSFAVYLTTVDDALCKGGGSSVVAAQTPLSTTTPPASASSPAPQPQPPSGAPSATAAIPAQLPAPSPDCGGGREYVYSDGRKVCDDPCAGQPGTVWLGTWFNYRGKVDQCVPECIGQRLAYHHNPVTDEYTNIRCEPLRISSPGPSGGECWNNPVDTVASGIDLNTAQFKTQECDGPAEVCEFINFPGKLCPPGHLPYTTVTNNSDADRSFEMGCMPVAQCRENWMKYSSADKCINYDGDQISTSAYTCTSCCVGDYCNEPQDGCFTKPGSMVRNY